MADKKVRIGVDDTAIEQYQSKLRQSAEQLARGMVQDVRKYTTSSKELTSAIDDQIRAIEKRNRLETEFRQARIEKARESGKIDEGSYKSQMSQLRGESREDKLQTQLLRELIETVKNSSKEEIRQDRTAVEKRISSSKRVSQLSPQGDELEILKETLQAGELSRLGGEEADQRMNLMRSPITGGDLLGARDAGDFYGSAVSGGMASMRGAGGAAGVIGGLLAFIGLDKAVNAAFNSARTLESSLGQYGQYTGANTSRMGESIRKDDITALSKMEFKPSDLYGGYARFAGGARTMDFGESAVNLMALEKAMPLDQGTISGVTGLRRFGAGTNATQTALFFEKYLQQTGQDIAALSETVQVFTQEARNVALQTNKVNTENIATVLASFGEQTGFKGEAMSNVFGKVRQGFTRSSNSVIQALQFRAASRAAGDGATLFDLEKIMADPLNNPEYMTQVLEQMQGVTGGGQRYQRGIMNMFNLTPQQAELVSNWDIRKGVSKEMLNILKEKNVSASGRAVNITGEVGESAAKTAGLSEKYGYKGVEFITEKFNNGIDKLIEWVEKNKKEKTEYQKKVDENIEALLKGDYLNTHPDVYISSQMIDAYEQQNFLLGEISDSLKNIEQKPGGIN
jgi:hypothetical protein